MPKIAFFFQSKEMESLKREIEARESSVGEENARREEKAAKMLAGEDTWLVTL